MTLQELKTKANSKLSDFWDALVIKQESYHLKNDNYFQLLVTSPVVDGADTTFVVTHPNDEAYTGDVQFAFASPIPFQIQVDTWGNETERGYTMTCIVELLDGRRFTRSRSLTDTRKKTQDVDNTDPENPVPTGSPYYVGADPVIDTTAWEEIIPEQI